jgi:hypothetical protein
VLSKTAESLLYPHLEPTLAYRIPNKAKNVICMHLEHILEMSESYAGPFKAANG